MINLSQAEIDYEEWKDLKGCKYHYQISNMGRFKRVTSYHKKNENTITFGSYDKKGYLRVQITVDDKKISKKVHRLVAEYFKEGYREDLTVNHINFIKDDNRASNLELMTAVENIKDYYKKIGLPNSSSSFVGVMYHSSLNKWVSTITEGNQKYSLGTYETEAEAVEAQQKYRSGLLKPKIGKGSEKKFDDIQVQNILYLEGKISKKQIMSIFDITLTTLNNYLYNYGYEKDETKVEEWVKNIKGWDKYKPAKGRDSSKFKDRVGEKFLYKGVEEFIIIEYNNKENCTIKFTDGTIIGNLNYYRVKNSKFKKNRKNKDK